jgi:hypothetical protein
MFRRMMLFIFVLSLAGVLLTGCGTNVAAATPSSEDHLKMAPMSMMPEEVQSAPRVTQQAYQFAVANPDIVQHIPCYCGCGAMGHTSNYACYVRVSMRRQGQFDGHALGCSICGHHASPCAYRNRARARKTSKPTSTDYSRFGLTKCRRVKLIEQAGPHARLGAWSHSC